MVAAPENFHALNVPVKGIGDHAVAQHLPQGGHEGPINDVREFAFGKTAMNNLLMGGRELSFKSAPTLDTSGNIPPLELV
jgi:hypothetical protein